MSAVRAPRPSRALVAASVALALCSTAALADAPRGLVHDVELDALLMLDASSAGGLHGDGEARRNGASVRRARLGLGGDIGERAEAELAVDVDPDEGGVELHELSLGYRLSSINELALGFMKQPFGLENASSSSRLRTMERSVATNAFAPDRGVGLAWVAEGSNRLLAAGVFVDPDAEGAREASARTVWAPVDEDRSVLHVGASGAYRDNAGEAYRIRDEGGIADGDNVVRSGKFAPDGVATVGLEAAWARDSVSVQAEWFGQRLSGGDVPRGAEPEFTGAYVQGGWVLGGGRRKYSKGRFGKVVGGRLERPVELVAGAGTVDLSHAGRGDRARQYLVGANVQLGERLRINAQLQRLLVEGADRTVERGDGALLRLQLDL